LHSAGGGSVNDGQNRQQKISRESTQMSRIIFSLIRYIREIRGDLLI
jgi:hypothetical protein